MSGILVLTPLKTIGHAVLRLWQNSYERSQNWSIDEFEEIEFERKIFAYFERNFNDFFQVNGDRNRDDGDDDDDDDDNDDDDILMVTKLTSQGRQLLIYRKLSMLWIVKNDFCQVGIAFPWTFTNTQSLMWWSSVSKINVYTILSLGIATMLFVVN